uniref:ATP synthase complex subunit 8 n=1 Tax=Isotomurus maculatus TaxID=36143 RepID=A0A5P9W9A5_9HEXA|nr:ATP synthase F0 subunit 8 [Isotomurus maculatus]
MPQMAPLSWALLFITFIIIYAVNTTKIYFSAPTTIESKTSNLNTHATGINWKW